MNHSLDTKCCCTVFKNRYINLKLLCIHKIIVQIEDFFRKFKTLNEFYDIKCLKKITFHVKVRVTHVSQLKSKTFLMKCNIPSLLFVLSNYFNLDEIVSFSIELLDENIYYCSEIQYKLNQSKVNYEIYYVD